MFLFKNVYLSDIGKGTFKRTYQKRLKLTPNF